MQRITTVWPNLLRRVVGRGNEGEQPLLQSDGSDAEDNILQINEDQLLADYRLLSWTRLIQTDGFEPGLERKWPMGPDIVEECQTLSEMPAVDPDGWQPIFEPTDFNNEHGPLEVEQYRLP